MVKCVGHTAAGKTGIINSQSVWRRSVSLVVYPHQERTLDTCRNDDDSRRGVITLLQRVVCGVDWLLYTVVSLLNVSFCGSV